MRSPTPNPSPSNTPAPDLAATLAELRAWARDPCAVVCTVCTERGPIAILPADVVGKTDDQLLALLQEARLATQKES